MDRLEFKGASLAVDEAGQITGLAAVFDTPDRGGDIIRKGAFSGARPPMPMLASHNDADVIGVWNEFTETAEGLAVKGRLLVDDVARAREVRALVQAGAMRGLSIGYIATKKAARKGGGRDLLAVELLEVSLVATPMHPDARVTDINANDGGKENTMSKENETQEGEAKTAPDLETKAADLITKALAPFVARLDKIEAKASRPDAGDGKGEISAERKAFAAYLRGGDRALGEAEKKALTLSDAAVGQIVAPPELQAEILRDLVVYNPMRALIDVKSVNVNDLYYNKRLGRPVGGWTTENGVIAATEFNFENVPFKVHTYSTQVQVSNFLTDDVPMVETEIREAIAEDFGLSEGLAFLNGTGSGNNQPEGLMATEGLLERKNGHAANLSADALIRMIYDLPAEWRRNAVFMANATTLAAIRVMKDTNGQYLWQPSLQAGQPDRIAGYPVLEMPAMPSIAANAFPVIFGDMKGYRAVERMAMSFMVDPYSLADQRKTRIFATRRLGGKVLDKSRFVKLKMAA